MLEYEWYENVRNGWEALCDRCNDNINRDEFFTQRNQRGVYCERCWNWIHLKKYRCNKCDSSGTLRSERPINLKSCGCGNIIEIK